MVKLKMADIYNLFIDLKCSPEARATCRHLKRFVKIKIFNIRKKAK